MLTLQINKKTQWKIDIGWHPVREMLWSQNTRRRLNHRTLTPPWPLAPYPGPRPHLGGVHGGGDEGGLGQEVGGAQQVADPLVVSLVLLHGLHVHLLLGQQCLVARRVAGWRQELEVSVATAQQETHSGRGGGVWGGVSRKVLGQFRGLNSPQSYLKLFLKIKIWKRWVYEQENNRREIKS